MTNEVGASLASAERHFLAADVPGDEQSQPATREASDDGDIYAGLRSLSVFRQDSHKSTTGDEATDEVEARGTSDEEQQEPIETATNAANDFAADVTPATNDQPIEAADVFQDRAPNSSKPAHSAAVEDEESIDAYMSRLLTRMRGASGEAESTKEAATQRPAPPPEKPAGKPAVQPQPDREAEPAHPTEPVQLVARSAAPEKGINLAAMRELANMTARGAIDKHAHGRWSKAAIEKMVIGALVATCGVWLIIESGSITQPLGYSGLAALVVAGFLVSQAAGLFRNMKSIGRQTSKPVGPTTDVNPNTDAPVSEPVDSAADSVVRTSAGTNSVDDGVD